MMAFRPVHSGVFQGRNMLVQGDPFHLLPLLISSMNFSLFYHFLDAIAHKPLAILAYSPCVC